jgi:hypothetical protein
MSNDIEWYYDDDDDVDDDYVTYIYFYSTSLGW